MADKKGFNIDDLDYDNAKVIQKQEPVNTAAGAHLQKTKSGGVDSMYDKYKKTVFLFDISGSMGDGMLPDEINQMYHWTDEIQEKFIAALRKNMRDTFGNRYIGAWQKPTDADIDKQFQELVTDSIKREIQMQLEDPTEYDEQAAQDEADERFGQMGQDEKDEYMFMLTYGVRPIIGQDMKNYIIRQNLPATLNIQLLPTGVKGKNVQKMTVMKTAAKQFITERFDKYPDAQVIAFEFDDHPNLITRDISKQGLLDAVGRMNPAGGTNIFMAVETALAEFKRAPSMLKAHHVVLVTDAECYDGIQVEKDLFAKFIDLHVMLDFIQIKGMTDWGASDPRYQESAEALKRVCKATGGEYTEVNTPAEFTQKFLAAANRLCLPPKR